MDIIRQTLVPQSIIIVDQMDGLTTSLKEKLTSHGFLVISTTDADGVPKVVQDAKIDLLIINVGLDHYDGFKALHGLRIHSDLRNIPIIAVSDDSGHLKQAIDLGASDFVARNNEYVDRLTELVEKYLVHLTARYHGEIN